MSDKSLLNRYIPRRDDAGSEDPAKPETEATDDHGCFGWLRGIRDRAIMLELRKKTGNVVAIGYAWIERIEFDPSEGITLHALGQKIRIKGRNLNVESRAVARLFDGLARHRVPWIKEAEEASFRSDQRDATVIERIEV